MPRPALFGNPLSPHVRALVFALTEKDITCTTSPREQHANLAKMAALNVADRRLIGEPGLKLGDDLVHGSETCLRFVEDAFPAMSLQPSSPADRARMNRTLEVYYKEAIITMGWRVAAPYVEALALSTFKQPMRDEHMADAKDTREALVSLLGDRPFFGGAQLCLADVAVSSMIEHLSALREYDEIVPVESPLRPWFKRVSSRSAFDLTKQNGGAITGLFHSA